MQPIKAFTPRSILLIASIALSLLIVLWTGLKLNGKAYWVEGVRGTKLRLGASRASIEAFAKRTGRFPSSLAELSAYMKQEQIFPAPPAEFISRGHGDFSEHRELDSSGGLYYNPATGKIKVNLAKPLRCYHWTYFGPGRNEIPADW
jgi:hypothetical protein